MQLTKTKREVLRFEDDNVSSESDSDVETKSESQRKSENTKIGSFDTIIYSELYHYFPVDEQQDEQVPNTAALYRNEGSRKQLFLPQEYVWWGLMSVMVHATSLYGPKDEPEHTSLSFSIILRSRSYGRIDLN
jgi:hypothetical protein